MRNTKMEPIEIKSASDYKRAKTYILDLLCRNKIPKPIISENMLIFEALFHEIIAQKKDEDTAVRILGREHLGIISLSFFFEGELFVPEKTDPAAVSPEKNLLQGYADKIDYSYQSGHNKIRMMIRKSNVSVMLPSVVSIFAAIALWLLLKVLVSEETEQRLFSDFVYPLEMFFGNAMLMIGAPVTFLSLMKNLTDTYIVAERDSGARKLRNRSFLSSLVAVVLAVAAAFALSWIVAERGAFFTNGTNMKVSMSFQEFFESLLPSDIFSPFKMISPFPLIIVAIIATYSLCSVGKHFDRLKKAIDTCYALLSRMLGIIMTVLPVFMFVATLDICMANSWHGLLYNAELTLAVAAGTCFMILFYAIRLKMNGIRVIRFGKKLVPLLGENYRINSAMDAAPYNIRYCSRVFGINRNRLNVSIPLLAQINLDGNCFFITFIMLILMFTSNTKFEWGNIAAVAMLVFFLSLGAPNQPGSFLIGMLIILTYMNAMRLLPLAIYCEVAYGFLLNLTNIAGDIVTTAVFDRKEKSGQKQAELQGQ